MIAWLSIYFKITIAMLAIVDPLGGVPIFISTTHNQSSAEQRKTAKQAAYTVLFTLIAAIWTGDLFLNLFGISIHSFRIGGGILILLMAIHMLYAQPSPTNRTPTEEQESLHKESVGVVPLGIPILSGPGAIALTIVSAKQAAGFIHLAVLTLCAALVAWLTWVVLTTAPWCAKKLGRTGINIATRLMGLILAAIAIEFIASGALVLFPGLAGKS